MRRLDESFESTGCAVYDQSDPFTEWLQVTLAFMALLSLLFKRNIEHPRRTWRTWILDVSKIGLGSVYAHLTNLVLAKWLSQAFLQDNIDESSGEVKDECAWYAINFLADSTLGLVLSILLLRAFTSFARLKDWETQKYPGNYTYSSPSSSTPDKSLTPWIHQLIAWMMVLTVTKAIVTSLLFTFNTLLTNLSAVIFKPFENHNRLELIFVMVLFPSILNVWYFWVLDSALNSLRMTNDQSAPGPAHLSSSTFESENDFWNEGGTELLSHSHSHSGNNNNYGNNNNNNNNNSSTLAEYGSESMISRNDTVDTGETRTSNSIAFSMASTISSVSTKAAAKQTKDFAGGGGGKKEKSWLKIEDEE